MKELEALKRRRDRLRADLEKVDAEILAEVQRIQSEESRSMTAAARVLGVTRQSLYKLLRDR